MSDYRFDKRSKEQFAKDIAECTQIEKLLMEYYVSTLNKDAGRDKYRYEDNGIDNTGQFITDLTKVKTDADFVLIRDESVRHLIDVKFSRKVLDKFHLKINQMRSYINNDVCVINFMGVDGDDIKFCILRPIDLQYWLDNGEAVTFWHKDCIRFPSDQVEWHSL